MERPHMTMLLLKFLRFHLERWIQRGILHQLLLMAAAIAFVAGGLIAWLTTSKFEAPAQAIWWAFLRLTDPGYLGDDEGVVLRSISTAVTILGYVLFMGSLIAIMTQWLAHTLREMESGHTPIAMKDHIVILGWTNRTPEIISMLLSARGRLQRFLDRHGVSKLRVVILSQEVNAQRRLELRDHLKEDWDENRIFLRSGSTLQPEHLQRLDLERAAAIVVPGADFALGGVDLTDTRVVKTLLTVNCR
jgi:TRAP-type C4-dicarboxylate transport system permease small subunit